MLNTLQVPPASEHQQSSHSQSTTQPKSTSPAVTNALITKVNSAVPGANVVFIKVDLAYTGLVSGLPLGAKLVVHVGCFVQGCVRMYISILLFALEKQSCENPLLYVYTGKAILTFMGSWT